MPVGSVLAFWLVALLLVLVPGADWAFTIGAGLRGQPVLPAVGGLIAGYLAVTAVVAAGVGAAVAGTPAVLTGLTIVGGLYLTWLGVRTSARPPVAMPVSDEPVSDEPVSDEPVRTGWGLFAQGIGVSGLNPKGLLVFLALLPQFTDPAAQWPVAGQIAVLGLAFTFSCAAFYLALGTAARTVLHARPAVARTVSRLSGAAMVVIGIALLLDRLVV